MRPVIVNIYEPGEGGSIEYGFIDSPFGRCLVGFNRQGLCAFEFINDYEEVILERLKDKWEGIDISHNPALQLPSFGRLVLETNKAVNSICLNGTPFQIQVWKTLMELPIGSTASYSQIAQMIGNPNAVRAVASAIAANHIAMLIPCHRVIRSNRKPGEYRWGSDRKKAIIEWEREFASIGTNILL